MARSTQIPWDVFLVVLEPSHPLRPVGRLDPAGFSPRVAYVKASMPLKSPQLLKPNLPDGEIQKNAVCVLTVPIETKTLHLQGTHQIR